MSQPQAAGRRKELVSELAASSGVEEEDVSRVLDQLGLSENLGQIGDSLSQEAIDEISIDDIRVSVSAGGMTIAK